MPVFPLGKSLNPFSNSFEWIVNKAAPVKREASKKCSPPNSCIKSRILGHIYYHLHYWSGNRQFKHVLGELNSENLQKAEGFNVKNPTVIITHGWIESCHKSIYIRMIKG